MKQSSDGKGHHRKTHQTPSVLIREQELRWYRFRCPEYDLALRALLHTSCFKPYISPGIISPTSWMRKLGQDGEDISPRLRADRRETGALGVCALLWSCAPTILGEDLLQVLLSAGIWQIPHEQPAGVGQVLLFFVLPEGPASPGFGAIF